MFGYIVSTGWTGIVNWDTARMLSTVHGVVRVYNGENWIGTYVNGRYENGGV